MFVIEPLADAFGDAAGELLGMLMTWWLVVPSPLEQVTQVRGVSDFVGPIAVLILMVSMLTQIGRMMISGRREPLIEVGLGLLKFAVVNATALLVLNLALNAADALSRELVEGVLPQFSEKVNRTFEHAAIVPTLKFVVAFAVVGLGLIQWLLLLFRQAAILVLVALLPLAASGVLTNATRRWLPTMVAWLIGLVIYKPLAALIYAIGLGLVAEGEDFVAVLTGIVVLLIAVIALPAAMKFFSWAQVGVGGGGSAGGVIAGAATGAVSMGALGSSRRQEMTGPGSAPGWAQGAAAPTAGGTQKALPPGGSGGGGGQAGGGAPGDGGGSAGRTAPPWAWTGSSDSSKQGGDPGGGGAGGGGTARGGSSGAAAARGATPTGGAAAGKAAGGAAGAGAAGGAAAGGAAAAAGPAGAAAAAAGTAAQKGRAAADNFAAPPQDLGDAPPSKGPDGAGPAGQGGN
ncbi:hypothetical protein [Pseudonocardia parietis]|uniref:TrbL/VirB6 plasmid conjugal transfer protein n=1 Tax=Pseudonocardia parietis TaxID=570936 RepID=A0ABS4W5D1_9PSEU|nr:hypothetical protein [Pseudonocardia parietis]MBP2371391.1 hypothetical protein [Pseudonocardia parietis]